MGNYSTVVDKVSFFIPINEEKDHSVVAISMVNVTGISIPYICLGTIQFIEHQTNFHDVFRVYIICKFILPFKKYKFFFLLYHILNIVYHGKNIPHPLLYMLRI